MNFKEEYTELQDSIVPDTAFLEQLARKMEQEKKRCRRNPNDELILDISEVSDQNPMEVVVESRRTSFWKITLSASCLVCVLAIGVFVAAKLQGSQPVGPGSNDSTITENSSYESNSSSSSLDSSETSDNDSNSSDLDSSGTSDQSSKPEPEPVYIGNGMTLTGTLLDKSELEEFSIEPYISSAYFAEADEDFFNNLEIPELKDVYRRAVSLFGCLSTTELNPTFAAAGNGRKPARIAITKDDGVYGGEYIESGYTYESFYNAFLSVFTKDVTDAIFKEYDFFLNYNGALFCEPASGGGNIFSGSASEVHREYNLIFKDDTFVKCRRIVFGYDRDFKPAMEYIPELRDEYDIYELYIMFVLTEDGWRIMSLDNLDKAFLSTTNPFPHYLF